MTQRLDIKSMMDMVGAPVTLIAVLPDNRFSWLQLNSASENYYQMVASDYVGQMLDDFEGLPEHDIFQRKRAIKNYQHCVNSQKPVFSETKHQLDDGSFHWGRHTLVPIFNSDGKVCQIIVTSIDITELVETRLKLESAVTKVLSGFVTICAGCKKIESDGQWESIEKFAAERMDFHEFSHGLCDQCVENYYADNQDTST